MFIYDLAQEHESIDIHDIERSKTGNLILCMSTALCISAGNSRKKELVLIHKLLYKLCFNAIGIHLL